MTDFSDYNLPRTKLHELLPNALDSNANTAMFENLFNRFLTKEETRRVAGYIGEGNPNALISRQIAEPTIARQANQLQPILYNRVGSIDHMASWADVLNELERSGIDISQLPQWGQAQQFNWVPPIDIDKIINYLEYFWVDENSSPEYITVKNRSQILEARLSTWQRHIDELGDTFPIVGIGASPTGSQLPYNKLIVNGDITSVFIPGFEFYVNNSTNAQLNDIAHTVIDATFDITINRTTITTTSFAQPDASGNISLLEELAKRTTALADQTSTPTGPTGRDPVVSGLNQWIDTNHWQHRTTVTNFATATQAELPIIEYDDNLELNEWTLTDQVWKYRGQTSTAFAMTDAQPSLIELQPLEFTVVGNTLVISGTAGNQTETFSQGTVFETINDEIVEVDSSVFVQASPTSEFTTIVTLAPSSSIPASDSSLQPVITSQGDPWFGYSQHWVYLHAATPVAAPHQTPNPFIQDIITGVGTDVVNGYTFRGSCLLYTSPSPRDGLLSRMPSSA